MPEATPAPVKPLGVLTVFSPSGDLSYPWAVSTLVAHDSPRGGVEFIGLTIQPNNPPNELRIHVDAETLNKTRALDDDRFTIGEDSFRISLVSTSVGGYSGAVQVGDRTLHFAFLEDDPVTAGVIILLGACALYCMYLSESTRRERERWHHLAMEDCGPGRLKKFKVHGGFGLGFGKGGHVGCSYEYEWECVGRTGTRRSQH